MSLERDDDTAVAEPKCPECAIRGIEHIISRESVERSRTRQPWFLVVHCAVCGHVYDIIAKHTFAQPVTPRLVLPKIE
jgi:uncharacterized Zn finger protein